MAQIRSEPDLGRSILTPQPSKRKPTAKRTGILFPVGHGEARNTPSACNDKPQEVTKNAIPLGNYWPMRLSDTTATSEARNGKPQYVAPTAKMVSSQPREERAATPPYTGKGKGRATEVVSKQTPSPTVGKENAFNQADPMLTSDIFTNSQALAVEDARRRQEEVDRLESKRDREDEDFCHSGASQDDSQTQEWYELHETPRRRSRRTTDDSIVDMPTLQQDTVQSNAAQPKPAQQLPLQQKQQIPQKPAQQKHTSTKQVADQHTITQQRQQAPVQPMPQLQEPVQQPMIQQKQQAQEVQFQQWQPPGQNQQRQQQQQQQQSESRKRKADTESPSEQPRLSPITRNATLPGIPTVLTGEVQPRISDRHNNKRFDFLKASSQAQRRTAVKAIRRYWSITEDQLMDLPYAPRRTYEQGNPVMTPLNWNTKLLEAVVDLAKLTKGDFAEACNIASAAFEEFGRLRGAKQLTDEILERALAMQHQGRSGAQRPAEPASAQESAGNRRQSAPSGTSTRQPAVQECQSPDNIHVSRQLPTRPSLIVKLPVCLQIPPVQDSSPAAAYPSPPARPVKSEHVVPIMQEVNLTEADEGSSSGDEHLNLESERKILEYRLAIIKEKLDIDARKKKERERRAARARLAGGSAGEPLLV